MAAPLWGRRPKRKAKPPRTCMTAGCGRQIPRWQWLCRPCFESLPFHDRKAIAEACEAREPPRIYGLCRAAATFLAEKRAAIAEAK